MATVLIVEDDESIQRLLERIVTRLGHTTILVADGPTALAREREAQLVICDMNLPGEPKGLPLLQQLRARNPNRPVVVSTGYVAGETFDQLVAAGFNEIIKKPFDLMAARALITSLLGSA